MSVIENSKVTVVGAGSVGSSVAYAALIRGSARHVALYDINTAKVDAEILDLAHGTLFTGSSDISGGSDISVAEGSHVVVITAGAKQNPGQSRIELAGVNAGILRKMLPQLLEVAPDAVYVIVTNPCDVLTVFAQEETGLPRSDSSRQGPSSTPHACGGNSPSEPGSPPRACTPTSSVNTATRSSLCGPTQASARSPSWSGNRRATPG